MSGILKIFFTQGSQILILTGFISVLSACGVRGRPQPPNTPPEIGRGQPNYKGATQDMAFPDVPSPMASPTATPSSSRTKQ